MNAWMYKFRDECGLNIVPREKCIYVPRQFEPNMVPRELCLIFLGIMRLIQKRDARVLGCKNYVTAIYVTEGEPIATLQYFFKLS